LQDVVGNQGTVTLSKVVVMAGDVTVLETPLNYPNPFNPSLDGTTAISYKLSKDSDITVAIYDIAGNKIWQENRLSGSEGGKGGYNEVTWNGKNMSGELVGNGMYLLMIINTSDNKVLGRGKITIYR
jgi:flagellar hook assembly protein FlgD